MEHPPKLSAPISPSFSIAGWPTELTEAWKPNQHPHIEIRFETRRLDPLSGMPEDQSFEVRCHHVSEAGVLCGGRWRGSCSSGRLREKALVFAVRHLHRPDPFTGGKL